MKNSDGEDVKTCSKDDAPSVEPSKYLTTLEQKDQDNQSTGSSNSDVICDVSVSDVTCDVRSDVSVTSICDSGFLERKSDTFEGET